MNKNSVRTEGDTIISYYAEPRKGMHKNQVIFLVLKVRNLTETTSVSDLTNLFGLHATPYLKKWSAVEIEEGDERVAKVICPEDIYEELRKLNGVEYEGKNLVIQGEVDGNDEEQTPTEQSPENEEILFMLLDCRNHPDLNFNPVKEIEVCEALHIQHADDLHKAVKTYEGNRKGTFGIQSTDMERYVGTNLVIRGHEIPLKPIRKRPRGQRHDNQFSGRQKQKHYDPDSLKIRIFDAWELRYRKIDYNLFDEHFRSLGAEIIRSTQPERCRDDPDIFNTNRYIVVKKTNENGELIAFGNRITIDGISFKLSYFGIQRYCGLCQRSHGWDCPIKTRNDFLRQLRAKKTQQSKIYSDSTLRHVNQVALTNDVACMSGGGIAQMCNAIPYDQPHSEVIINGGTNDLKQESLQEFVYIVEKTVEKVTKLAESVPVTVVLPPISTDIPAMIAKGKFLSESIGKVTNTIQLKAVDMEDANHPSKEGTMEVVKQINAVKNIILPQGEDDTVLAAKYRGVQTIFKVGCRGCDDLNFTRSLCAQCQEDALKIDVATLENEIRNITEKMFPQMEGGSANEVEMKDKSYKRGPTADGDDVCNASVAKSARNSTD